MGVAKVWSSNPDGSITSASGVVVTFKLPTLEPRVRFSAGAFLPFETGPLAPPLHEVWTETTCGLTLVPLHQIPPSYH